MSGFLGTAASLWSDLTLVLTILLGGVALFGALRARQDRFGTHCPVMAIAALTNWIPVLLRMIPKWLELVVRSESVVSGPLVITPLLHGVLGLGVQGLMTYTVTRMYWLERLPPERPIWLMRITLGLWMLMVIGGIVVYVLYVFGI
jgi:hypothetical protein